ncbi:MAG: hypothetical protein ACREKK_01800, partial [Candidatus Methylomirabilales bacterium]
VNPLPRGFGQILRGLIAQGLPPREAMRKAWRRIRVARQRYAVRRTVGNPDPTGPIPQAHEESERASRRLGLNPGRRPIRYATLTDAEREAIVTAYRRAREFTGDPLHAAAIAAREVLIRSDKEWNTARGSDAFGAAVAVLAFRKTIKVNPRGRPSRATYCPERVAPPGRFDPRSFRTVRTDGHLVTVGCPKGKYDARRKRCKVGTRAQRILHPPGEAICPLAGREVRPRRRRNPLTRSETTAVLRDARRARQEALRHGPTSMERLYGLGRADAYWRTAIRHGRAGGRLGRRVRGENPPAGAVELYRRVDFIGATKGRTGRYAGQRFVHHFKTPARVLGLPDGSLLVQPSAGR